MILAAAIAELLAGLVDAVPGVGACIVGPGGAIDHAFGAADGMQVTAAGGRRAVVQPGRACATALLPDGDLMVVTVPSGEAGRLLPWLQATLSTIAQREQLELDMESMNHSSLQLLEQVAMLGETLPRLSACESVAEIATTGLKACVVAAGVERAVYLHLHEQTGFCEALVYVELAGNGQTVERPYPLPPLVPVERGVLAAALASDDTVVWRQVVEGGVGSDTPESLARREVLGVQVGYDAGGSRVCLGALLLFDKARSSYSQQGQLGSEEGQVASSFASMLGAVLGARQTAELGKELSMAQAIQGQILPARPALVAGFELAGDYRTSGEVGGDYFDYVPMADGRTLVVVADVSGHNLASGMMMVSARATLRTLAAAGDDPARVFEDLGASMFEDLTRTERFITAAGVTLRPADRHVEVVNAGHNEILHWRARARRVERLGDSGPILGFLPRAGYGATALELEPGDCLLLYTDGVTEATSEAGEMFGEERLAAIFAGAAERGARAVVAGVLAAVRGFRGPHGRGDDITVVAIKAVPAPGGQS